MNILISGGGVAGLTLAYWLRRYGHDCAVLEKAPNVRNQGYMIDFGGTGWDVADRMELIPALTARQHPIERIRYRDAAGATTSQITTAKLYRAANAEGKFLVLDRCDLVETLYEHTQPDIRFNTTIQAVRQSEEGVCVTYDDGDQAEYDLLVGADGIHSQTRDLIFGPESTFRRYLGYHFAVFALPAPTNDLEDRAYHIYVEPDIQFGLYPDYHGQWMAFVVYRTEDPTLPPREARAGALRRHLQKAEWIVPEVLDRITNKTPIFHDTVTQICMERWLSNRVALIGDAAYCPTLVSGQGASMAMAGAYFLAQELHRQENWQEAFDAYEQRLRPHIERIQESARSFAPTFVPRNRLRIRLINWMLRLADLPLISRYIGKQFEIESIL